MTFEEWTKIHDEKAKKHSPTDVYHEEAGEIFFDEDNGFIRFVYNQDEKRLYLTEIVGNYYFWEPRYLWVARMKGATKVVGFSSMKNPKVIERLFKAKIEKEIPQEGGILYQFVREV